MIFPKFLAQTLSSDILEIPILNIWHKHFQVLFNWRFPVIFPLYPILSHDFFFSISPLGPKPEIPDVFLKNRDVTHMVLILILISYFPD